MLEWFLKNTGATKTNYDEASKLILDKFKKDESRFKEVIEFFEDENNSNQDKYLIIDRIKAILATEERIKDIRSLHAVVNQRNNVYQTLKWPNGKKLWELGINIDSKEFVKNNFKSPEDLVYVRESGLIGFTSFYRRGTEEGRGLSLTALGETNVLGGHMKSLEWDQRAAAEEWFFGKKDSSGEKISSGNLEKYSVQQAEIYRKVREMVGEPNLSKDRIKELFQWKRVDIWEKMVKLDFEYVFYLLAECANESIGLNIKGIQVFDKESVSMKKEGGSMTFNRSEGIAGVNVESSKIDVWVTFGGGKKEKEEEIIDNDGTSNPEDGSWWNDGTSNPEDGSNEWGEVPWDWEEDNFINEWENIDPVNPEDVPDSF